MQDWWTHPAASSAIAVLVILALAGGGYWIVSRLRPATGPADTNPDAIGDNFAELQREGAISDAELRRIKAVIGNSQPAPTDG